MDWLLWFWCLSLTICGGGMGFMLGVGTLCWWIVSRMDEVLGKCKKDRQTRNNILGKNLCPLKYTIMADFTLLAEKFDKAALAAQGKEWAKELEDEAHAQEKLSMDSGDQLSHAREFYEGNVDFVNEQHALRMQMLRDIPAAVAENDSLQSQHAELQDYVADPARQEFAQKLRELAAMDQELYEMLLASGRLGRPPVVESVAEEEPAAVEEEAAAEELVAVEEEAPAEEEAAAEELVAVEEETPAAEEVAAEEPAAEEEVAAEEPAAEEEADPLEGMGENPLVDAEL